MSLQRLAKRAFFLLALAAITGATAAETTPPPSGSTKSGTEAAHWGYIGLANPADWALPQVTISPTSDIGKLPYGQVYATARQRVLHYRFPVPDGTYKVRIHFLQAVGRTTKNEVGLSAAANGVKIVDNLDVYAAKEKAKELPADVVAKTSQADVASKGGQIMVSFPVTTKPNWAVCALEVIGKQATIRVNCGAQAPYTDANGHVWESDWDRRLPLTSGEIALEKRPMSKGEWVNISDEILRKLRDELGLVPVSVWPYFFAAKDGWVVCDRSGNTYVGYLGLGLWRYDLAAGKLTKADEGRYTAEARGMCLSLNPDKPGFFLMGWSGQSGDTFAVRCTDGSRFEGMDGGAQHNGWDNIAVDWTADPPVVFVKVHHTKGMTKLSTDGGKTFKQVADDGTNLLAIGALGDGVLVKFLKDGTILRSSESMLPVSSTRNHLRTPPQEHSTMTNRCALRTRRTFLRETALVVTGATLAPALCVADEAPASGFTHRVYNGWITDIATEADPSAEWPSIRLDERLLQDYRETFAVMRRFQFNTASIWGLYVANQWPVDLQNAVTPERGKLVERLIASAHEHGIKLLSGLGTYSWGFAEIIKANPKLNGGNPNAMCASEPESHEWMRRIVDFVLTRFEIDGVSMQSADLGRCKCRRCAPLGDAEYHAAILTRTADYIRSKWPKKIVGMSNWGVSFGNVADKDTFAKMSRSLDYMCDWNDSTRGGGPGYRREFIRALGCAFGTTGGLVVEPPLHWTRDRWFIPTCRRVYDHLRKLHEDGGHAVEFYCHIGANPSSELTFHVASRTLADPRAPFEQHLAAAIEDLYQPRGTTSRDALAKLFLDAEEAYCRYRAKDECGTFSLEPLISSKAGPPSYLTERLKPEQLAAYAADLRRLTGDLNHLRPSLTTTARVDRIAACLKRVLEDVESSLTK